MTYFKIVGDLQTMRVHSASWEIKLFHCIQIGIRWQIYLWVYFISFIRIMIMSVKFANSKIVYSRRNR